MICSDGTVLAPSHCNNWGDWANSYSSCSSGYICGFEEKYETGENLDDETALNGVRFRCCDYTDSPTPAPTKLPSKSPTPSPTNVPTEIPTKSPTNIPTKGPTEERTTSDGEGGNRQKIII